MPLHGHMYQVYLALTTWVEAQPGIGNGMAFDYRYYKERVHQLCRQLNQTFLMPQFSPYLQYGSDADYYYFTFNHKKIPFLKEDVTILPVVNITVEELSRWFVEELTRDSAELRAHSIEKIIIKIFSAPGQSANYAWQCPHST